MAKKKIKGTPEKEKFLKELGKEYSQNLILKATSYELEFKKILENLDIDYRFQYPIVCNQDNLYILDFYLPEYKLVFEIDGKSHYTKSGKRYDSKRTRHLNKYGLRVIRISNSLVKSLLSKHVLDLIKIYK